MAIIKSGKSLKGIHVPHNKNTEYKESVTELDFDTIKIVMQQHMGAPCIPTVKVGDLVKVGDKIGDSTEYFSAPIHSSCSGKVTKIDDILTFSGRKAKVIIIENDKEYQKSENITPPIVTDKKSFLEAVRESGLVGLGGAGFPTHVKLDYKNTDILDKLVINSAECEPYITADFRECMENTDNVLAGIKAVQKYLGIKSVYFGIESNKPKALELLDEKTQNDDDFHVVKLKQVYPQGAEKSIIYATTGIVVKEGTLPADSGVVVMNVSTVGFLGKYLKDGMPLITKRITIDGDCIENPQNLIVPLGAVVEDVLKKCGLRDNYEKIIAGGPMMGIPFADLTAPIIKNNNAVLAFSSNKVMGINTTSCIRCGKCVSICPMNLMPTMLEKSFDNKDKDALNDLGINLCMNCGCCSYVCPAKRQLAQKNQLAKAFVRQG